MSVRRSSRSAYKSLIELERRAKAAEAAAQGPLWGEEAFADVEDDDESFDEEKHSDDGEDIVDSDFDEPEEMGEEDDEDIKAEKAVRLEERREARKAKTGKYVDPAKKGGRKGGGAGGGMGGAEKRARTEREGPTIHRSSLRRSTKIASLKAAEFREKRQQDEEERRRKKAAKKAEQTEERELTQEELLEEAKETEVKNRESLKELLKLEEEKKKVAMPKKKAMGPVLSTRSRGGVQTISFTDGNADAKKELFGEMWM